MSNEQRTPDFAHLAALSQAVNMERGSFRIDARVGGARISGALVPYDVWSAAHPSLPAARIGDRYLYVDDGAVILRVPFERIDAWGIPREQSGDAGFVPLNEPAFSVDEGW